MTSTKLIFLIVYTVWEQSYENIYCVM